MKPAPFDYVAAASVEHAVRVLAEVEGARVLAGGQALVPLLVQRAVRAPLLVDVGRVPGLGGMTFSGGVLRIGGGARLRAVEADPRVRAVAPVLAEAAALVGPVHVRNRATVGGSLAHADPSAEVPAALLAAGATVHTVGPDGPHAVGVDEFVTGAHRTRLGPAELVVAVEVPAGDGRAGGAFREFATRPGDLPIVGVACAARVVAGRCTRLALAACGVADRPVLVDVLGAVRGAVGDAADGAGPEASAAAAAALAAALDPPSDATASADYRRELAQLLTVEALPAAWRSAVAP